MKQLSFLPYSLLSGFFLAAGWPMFPSTFFLFIAFVPLLILAEKTSKATTFFLHSFIATLIWNVATTWWIWNSTDIGSVVAIVANSLLMCLPLRLYFSIQQKQNKFVAAVAFISLWMLFEYIHLNWQLSWPWLSIGNAFASQTNWIQWYEYTGIAGGTIWVLITNIFVKNVYDCWQQKQAITASISKAVLIIIAPIALSYLIKPSITTTNKLDNVVIVQPNIDPYQKFNEANASTQIAQLIQLSNQYIDSNTKLTIWPETALSVVTRENEISSNVYYQPVINLVQLHQNNSIITGIETYKQYGFEKGSKTARKASDGSFYDVFNAAVRLSNNDSISLYNKSKLVPGVESMPTFLNFLGSIFEQFGGTTGGYGRSDSSTVFTSKNNPYKAAPVICYESIYGEYVGTYVKKGANMIAIITNDGWWGNTPGHQQHLAYAQLRAIETRRWIARSANTGISAVINNVGEIVITEKWDTAGVIKAAIPTNDALTFYVQYGDYLYKIFSLIGFALIIFQLILWLSKKVRK